MRAPSIATRLNILSSARCAGWRLYCVSHLAAASLDTATSVHGKRPPTLPSRFVHAGDGSLPREACAQQVTMGHQAGIGGRSRHPRQCPRLQPSAAVTPHNNARHNMTDTWRVCPDVGFSRSHCALYSGRDGDRWSARSPPGPNCTSCRTHRHPMDLQPDVVLHSLDGQSPQRRPQRYSTAHATRVARTILELILVSRCLPPPRRSRQCWGANSARNRECAHSARACDGAGRRAASACLFVAVGPRLSRVPRFEISLGVAIGNAPAFCRCARHASAAQFAARCSRLRLLFQSMVFLLHARSQLIPVCACDAA